MLYNLAVTSETPIEQLHHVGPKILHIFHEANIRTVGEARNASGFVVQEAIDRLKTRDQSVGTSVWNGRAARVASILERLHDAAWIDVDPPEAFSCGICLEWLINAQKLPSGHLVDFHCITQWLKYKPENPFTREPLIMDQLQDVSAIMRPLINAARDEHCELIVRRRRDALDQL